MQVSIGNKSVGKGFACFVIAEIGINHNGDLGIAKELIDVARVARCDAVKFQIRDVDRLFSRDQLSALKESPWGTTYEQYVRGREFDESEMSMLVYHTMQPDAEILWGASYWACGPSDEYPLPDFIKVQSAAVRDLDHIRMMAEYEIPLVVSTGGATIEDVDRAVELLERVSSQYVLMQCNSTYPTKHSELGLSVIETYKRRYGCPVGFSSHELGISMSTCAVALGANLIERHITLDRTMWGTDHPASLEPQGIIKLVRDIRHLESALGDGKKKVYDGELAKIRTLTNAETTKS